MLVFSVEDLINFVILAGTFGVALIETNTSSSLSLHINLEGPASEILNSASSEADWKDVSAGSIRLMLNCTSESDEILLVVLN